MTFAVQAQVTFQNATRRNTVASAVQTKLGQMAPFGTVSTASIDVPPNTLAVEVAFRTKPEADDFWTSAIAAVGTGINGPVVGSKMWRHDCPRDGAQTGPCVIADQVVF